MVSRSATGGGRPRQAGPACRRQRGEREGTSGWAGEKENEPAAGLAGREEGRWERESGSGRKRELGRDLGPHGKKRRGGRDGPVGLKARRGKRNSFAFLKLIQTHSIQIRIQEFKFKLNHKQKEQCSAA